LARLEAAGRWFAERGWRVVGLEVARTDNTYAWNVADGAESFQRVTLFHDSYHALSPRQIARKVGAALDHINPLAVATVGWSFPEARAALRWCRKNEAPVICMSASKRDDAPRQWWKEALKRRIVGQFDAALVGGRPHAEYAAELGIPPDRIFAGYDAVDNDYFGRESAKVRGHAGGLRAELGLPDCFFLSVGRFVPKKNVDRLLKAYAVCRRVMGELWGLVLCGGGDLEGDLRALADRLRLEGVRWPGFVQYPHLPKYYGLASAFVLSSTTEQWGLVVNEAMASGLPVLVSEKAGCRYDLVEDGANGFLFDPFDVDDMGDAMRRMATVSDADRAAMGRRSREIIARWGPERFAEGLWAAVQVGARDDDGSA